MQLRQDRWLSEVNIIFDYGFSEIISLLARIAQVLTKWLDGRNLCDGVIRWFITEVNYPFEYGKIGANYEWGTIARKGEQTFITILRHESYSSCSTMMSFYVDYILIDHLTCIRLWKYEGAYTVILCTKIRMPCPILLHWCQRGGLLSRFEERTWLQEYIKQQVMSQCIWVFGSLQLVHVDGKGFISSIQHLKGLLHSQPNINPLSFIFGLDIKV